ncbi:MAG: TlpA family protein disulfide reductase [Proteobacteria bacterium]|nr:TlpA family protein disulfide reductase [Pseudomonadota bacterium]
MEPKASFSDLLGKPAPDWQLAEWANAEPMQLSDLSGRVVIVRFWTDGCPYCQKSLPALQTLSDEFAGHPVTFVGIYHSKPKGSERPFERAIAAANEYKVTFPLAYDRMWKTVTSWWLSGPQRRATSASFVVDAAGTFVHIHPGPEFFPSVHPGEAQPDRDFRSLRDAIVQALPAQQ